MTQAAADPRPQLAASLDQFERLVLALQPDDLARPTPCDDYDVRMLVAHVVAVLRKLTVVKDHADMTRVADPADDVRDREREAFHLARREFDQAWRQAPESELAADYSLAWGTMTGTELLDAYTHEFTAHAWDLAEAIGRGELDPGLAEAAIAWFAENVSPGERGEGKPFGAQVPVPDGADAYSRLAGLVGREAARKPS